MILITGAGGFIGKRLLEKSPGKIRAVNLKPIRGTETLVGDLTNPLFVAKAVKGVDTIVHLAAIIDSTDEKIFDVNVLATKLLLEEAKKNNVKKFIYISSENVLYDSKDNYTISKKEAEKIVKGFKNHVILRPTIVYGLDDEKYITKLLKLIKKMPIIPIFGNGEFQPVYIDDLIVCILKAIKNPIKGEYIVAGQDQVKFKDFIKKIEEKCNINKPIILIPPALVKPFIFIYERVSKHPIITTSQINNLNRVRTYNISKTLKAFKYKPTSLDSGFSTIF